MIVIHCHYRLLQVLCWGLCHPWKFFFHSFYDPLSSLEQLLVTWQLRIIVTPSIFIFFSEIIYLFIYRLLERAYGVFIQDVSLAPGSRTFIWKMLNTWCKNSSLNEGINWKKYFKNLIWRNPDNGIPIKIYPSIHYLLFCYSHYFVDSNLFQDNWKICM